MQRSQPIRNPYVARPLVPVVEPYQGTHAGILHASAPTNSFRAAYIIGSVYLFFLFSHATEFIDSGGRFHLVQLTAFLAMIAAIASGKLPDSFKSKPGIALTLFTLFLILGIPFSSWKGGSVKSLIDTWWKSYLTFFLVASLVFTLKQVRNSVFLLGGAAIGVIYFALKALKSYTDDRISVEYGSLGNSNDLAGALLLGLPFLVYVVLDKKRAALIRLSFFGLILGLLVMVVKTGSRASLLVVALMSAIVFYKAGSGNKLKMMVLCAVAACGLPFVITKDLADRYKTTFRDEATSGMSDTQVSAIASTKARQQLVKNAIELTIRHPVFGVGIGNFSNQSAELEIAKGNQGLWFTCHDIFLLVSSETGVMGFLFFMGTLFFSFSTLLRINRRARGVPELEDASGLAFSIFMSLIAYCACGLFATNAYTMQMPALAGLTVALDRITKPILAAAEERRMAGFRESIPVQRSKFAGTAAAALSIR